MTAEIKIGKSYYNIACKEEDNEKLSELSQRLNKRLKDAASDTESSDEKTLLVIAALSLEEELRTKTDDLFSRQDLFDSISNNIENITSYIEKLTKKIHNL